jgi:hypothetical protein
MLNELSHALPFLKKIPSDLLEELDTSTLYIPYGMTAQVCIELEKQLNCHIMTYRSVPLVSNGQERPHLCRLLVAASLTSIQLELLQSAELACHNEDIVLVAYKKPLQLRKLYASKWLANK